MSWTWFLFSFKGRFNRAKFWLAIVILAAISMVYSVASIVAISAIGAKSVVSQSEAVDQCSKLQEADQANCLNKNTPMMADTQTAQAKCDQLTEPNQVAKCRQDAGTAALKNMGSMFGKMLLIFIPLYLITFWISLAAYIKRFHDLDKSGWFFLFYFIPLANIAVFIWQGFVKGTTGPNRFGPDPIQLNTQGAVV